MTGGETELHYDCFMLHRALSAGLRFRHLVEFGIELNTNQSTLSTALKPPEVLLTQYKSLFLPRTDPCPQAQPCFLLPSLLHLDIQAFILSLALDKFGASQLLFPLPAMFSSCIFTLLSPLLHFKFCTNRGLLWTPHLKCHHSITFALLIILLICGFSLPLVG